MRLLRHLRYLLLIIALIAAGGAALDSCGPQTCTATISPPTSISQSTAARNSGETLCLHGGTYSEKVTLSKAGVAVVAVTGEVPIIDGTGISIASTDALLIVDQPLMTVDHLTIRNSTGRGMEVRTNANAITNNTISDARESGIITTNWFGAADHNNYTGNTITRTVTANTPCSTTGGWESAINQYTGHTGATGSNTYDNNTITNNNGEGMTLADNDVVTNNTIRDNYSFDLYLDNVVGVNAHDNQISETETVRPSCDRLLANGIGFADENNPARASNNQVHNNTVAGTKLAINFWNAGSTGTGLKNDTINDNTISGSWDGAIVIATGTMSNTQIERNTITSGNTTVSGVNQPGITYVP